MSPPTPVDPHAESVLDLVQGEYASTVSLAPPAPGVPPRPLDMIQIATRRPQNPEGIVLAWQATRTGILTSPAATDQHLSLLLNWGTARAGFAAQIDARKGGRLWLAATTLTVRALYEGSVGPTYQMAATAVFGAADAPRPTRTIRTPIVLSGAEHFSPIPDFADELVVYPANPADLAALAFGTVEFMPNNTPAPSFYAAAQAVSIGVAWPTFKLPNGAETVRITNTTSSNTTYVLVYTLAL